MTTHPLAPGPGADFPSTAPAAQPGASTAPTLTPDGAKLEIAARRSNAAFMNRYMEGDHVARAEMRRLYDMGYPSEVQAPAPTGPAAAQERINALRADRGFMGRYFSGDPQARAEMDQLYSAAHPAPDATPAASPPATRAELDALTIERVRFPDDAGDEDRALFRTTARDGLAALGATHGEAAHFAAAASDVLRQPDAFTPATAEAALRRAWGSDYQRNLDAAKAAVQRLPPAARAHLLESPVSNHPKVMQLLADAGRRMQGQSRR